MSLFLINPSHSFLESSTRQRRISTLIDPSIESHRKKLEGHYKLTNSTDNPLKMKAGLNTCLMACQILALINCAVALPLSARQETSGKSLLLWEWTLSRDAAVVPDIKTAIDQAAASPKVVATTNWDTWRPGESPSDLGFYPMVRTPEQLSGDSWTQLIASLEFEKAAGRVPIVQFYNEPEYLGVSAADAAASWRASILPLRAQYGAQLVGPATSSSEAGIAWQDAFMAALGANEKPDMLGIHFYTTDGQAVEGEVAWAQNYFTEAHEKYGIPLFVSEIASTSRDPAQVQQFSDIMEAWMDEQDWIVRYGFFGVSREPANDWVSPVAQLMTAGGQWSDLGKDLLGLAKA